MFFSALRDALGGVITYTYTSSSQVASITDPGGRTEYFSYDQEGRQVRHIDRRGTLTETRYNVYGKPVFQVCTDKKGRRQVMGSWAYDDFGHLTEAKAGGFTYTYEHRPDGKLLKKERNGKTVLTCTYYPEGSLKSLRDRRGKTLYYTYDGEGRLESLQTEEKKVLTAYTYTKAGRIESIRHHNGILTHYTYDEEGNVASLRIGKGENRLLYTASYTYDLGGNRLSKVGQRAGEAEREEALSATYTYDGMNRLIREDRPEGGEEYTYDKRGNRLVKTHYHYVLTPKARGMVPVIDGKESYCYNESNQLLRRETEQESTRYSYDANGSLVKEVTTRAGKKGGKKEEESTLYDYDFLNRQEKVELPGGRSQQAFYDGEGLRAGLTTPEGESYTFLYHQGELIEEEKAGEFLQAYLRGHGLVGIESKDNHYHSCHLDEQGSTLYVTSQRGEAENQYLYDAFGNLLDQKEGLPNRILYTGQQYDQEAGQYYLRARYYNPIIGRFLQEDTYRQDGLNLYAYCANNPVMYFDPDGHKKSSNECPGADPAAKQEETLNPEGRSGESGKASELPTVVKETKEWNDAVKSIANGENTSYRTRTATEAKELLNEARGNMNRYKQYTSKQYKKGYEMHPNEINTRNAPHNDLPHVKWKDWLDELYSGKGHIYFDTPNYERII